ncbi:hypothetical protein DFQ28_009467 [Apophysomyces sp. BC1034]|nr:hypothetical protein DFQ30_010452 [Apophysomyces sp. BC1015]KAG0185383.1 hypothetical protein DFQ28_009467 [Apophysomyces sp. BC1034]
MVALDIFFTKQKRSLLGLRERKDPTLQLLYRIAKEKMEVLLDVCDQMTKQIQKIVRSANDPAPSSKEKLFCYAQDRLDYLSTCKRKYSSAFRPSDLVVTPMEDPKELEILETGNNNSRETHVDQLPEVDLHDSDDLQFIRTYMKERKNRRMKWADCYSEGCKKGLFKSYKNAGSVKEMFHRMKKKSTTG